MNRSINDKNERKDALARAHTHTHTHVRIPDRRLPLLGRDGACHHVGGPQLDICKDHRVDICHKPLTGSVCSDYGVF